MTRYPKFAFANSSSHGLLAGVDRLKIVILTREITQTLDFFGMFFVLCISFLNNFGERCQKVGSTANTANVYDSVT